MSLLAELRLEHEVILEFLVCFEKMVRVVFADPSKLNREDFEISFSFIQNYVDKLHHGKEELALFPLAYESGLLQGGGPQCTKYFGLFLDNLFLDKFKNEISSADNIKKYHPRKQIQKILDENDPLAIPLKDHESGYYAVQLMKAEIIKAEDKSSWTSERLAMIARWYIDMLRQHIGKEDECLFVRIKTSFSSELIQRLDSWARDENEILIVEQAKTQLQLLKTKYT